MNFIRVTEIACLLFFLSACVSTKSEYKCVSESQDYRILQKYEPRYPVDAYSIKAKGWVIVRFDINEKGLPENIVISDSSPKNIFDLASVEAVQQFRFSPRTINCKPVSVVGVKYKFTFDRFE